MLTPLGPTADSLLKANLPVQLLSDGGPVDLPCVQTTVHTPKDDCSPVLRALLAAECKVKGKLGSGCGKGKKIEVLPWLQTGAPCGRAVSPLRLGLPESRAVSPLRLGTPQAGLCLPSDWGSLRQGCVSPQTGAP